MSSADLQRRLTATDQPAESYPTSFNWIAADDVLNSSSVFYLHQCGNYNAATNTGFIGGADLSTNTVRHESALVQGHYGNYVTAQSTTQYNVGLAYESSVTYGNLSSLEASASSSVSQRQNAIQTATGVEPYSVNQSATGVFLGPLNFSPYVPCQ